MDNILFKHIRFKHGFPGHNNISQVQSGSQSEDSTVNQLVKIYNHIISHLDKSKDIRYVFCGVSKAFHWVWHKGLLYKLKKISLDGNFLGWLENYITNRKQAVVLDGYTSRTVNLNAVLPQGSVLGPFFILTIHQ